VRLASNAATLTDDDNRAQMLDGLIELARADFMCFVELVFGVLHPGKELVYADYLQLMANILMRVEEGRLRRVIFNLPPRHMKSMMVSVLYVAWRLGRDPTTKFITISYGDDLAHHLSSRTRELMKSRLYRRIFPGTVLDKQAVDHVCTTKGGARYATSVGSDITGFGADVIIVDDPMQPDDAASELVKQRVRNWLDSSVLTRFDDDAKGALIVVMHRLAPDDLSATLEPTADYVVKLPLIAEKEEKYVRHGKFVMYRRPGDVLNPRRMTADDVARLEASLSRHVWDGQYQQRPTAGGSGMLSVERFRRFDLANPPAFELAIHSWDIGATVTGNASVCTKWGLGRDRSGRDLLYLYDVIRLKAELPQVRAAIKTEDRRDKPAIIILDERGVGLGVYQELRKEGYGNVLPASYKSEPAELGSAATSRPSTSKIDRFGKAILHIDDGRVLIPNAAPWLDGFLYEITAFPNVSQKDQVDSMSQLIAHMDNAIRQARINASRGWHMRR